MILYKYMPLRKDFFIDPLIRLTGPAELNDPFDSIPSDASVIKKTEHLARAANLSEKEFNRKIYITKDFDVKKRLMEVGVISLTEDYENLLMWSHYADEHRGIVVGFECDDTWLDYCPSNEIVSNQCFNERMPIPVRYRARRDDIRTVVKDTFFECNRHLMLNAYLVKSDSWIYEKEHRAIIDKKYSNVIVLEKKHVESTKWLEAFERSDLEVLKREVMGDYIKITINPESSYDVCFKMLMDCREAMFFVRPSLGAIVSVTFGCKVPLRDVDDLFNQGYIKEMSMLNPNIEYFHAEANSDEFKLNFHEAMYRGFPFTGLYDSYRNMVVRK